MRNSSQREAVLKVVKGATSHPRAEWIYEKVKKTIPNISLGTVYRNLGVLSENGQIQSINFDGVIHYDGTVEKHQHFYCNQCNIIFDISISNKKYVSKVEEKTQHKITDSHVHMNGVCSTCQTT